MADTRVQLEVENWIREGPLRDAFGQAFRPVGLRLSSGGVFDFDAVSEDGTIVASVSTSAARTASGQLGTGKLSKLRADFYFLLLVEATRRVVVLTERDMFDLCEKERSIGRVHRSIEFLLVELPPGLREALAVARRRASAEVAPRPDVAEQDDSQAPH